jgi:hypothetical protein
MVQKKNIKAFYSLFLALSTIFSLPTTQMASTHNHRWAYGVVDATAARAGIVAVDECVVAVWARTRARASFYEHAGNSN